MLAHDALQVFGCHVPVPHAVGLHTDDGAALARGHAAHARAFDALVALIQPGLAQHGAQRVEQGLRFAIGRAARAGADQQVARVAADFGFDFEWYPLADGSGHDCGCSG